LAGASPGSGLAAGDAVLGASTSATDAVSGAAADRFFGFLRNQGRGK
jgi:hypothetical protein